MTLCHHFTDTVPEGDHRTIPCDTPVMGRHVYVIRDVTSPAVFESYYLDLCEVMVQGYKHIGMYKLLNYR